MTGATIHPTRKAAALALVLAFLATFVFAASAQALPAKFWGVVPQTNMSDEHFERLARGGVESIRVPLGWADLQPQQGGPALELIGRQVAAQQHPAVAGDGAVALAGRPFRQKSPTQVTKQDRQRERPPMTERPA